MHRISVLVPSKTPREIESAVTNFKRNIFFVHRRVENASLNGQKGFSAHLGTRTAAVDLVLFFTVFEHAGAPKGKKTIFGFVTFGLYE